MKKYTLLLCILTMSFGVFSQVPKNTRIYAVNAQKTTALISTASNKIQLWDFNFQVGREFGLFTRAIRKAIFSPDGRLILVSTLGKEAQLWRTDGTSVATLRGHEYDILSMTFSEDGEYIATTGQDQHIILWNKQGKKLREWEGSNFPLQAITFSPDGKTLASGGLDNLIKLWDMEGNLQNTIKGHQSGITALCFSLDGKEIYAGDANRTLKRWNLQGNEMDSKSLNIVPTHIEMDKENPQHLIIWESTSKGIVIEKQLEVLIRKFDFINPISEPDPIIIPKVIQDIKMVLVEGDNITLNYTKNKDYVTIPDFYIGVYEVTQAQWQAVMGNNPSEFKDCPSCPVENVSWEDCQQFLKELNHLTGLNYRLPTEAEWYYAASGGKKNQKYMFAGSNNIDEVAWYWENSGTKTPKKKWKEEFIKTNPTQGKTHPVGRKKPNELGIYDLSGNVLEWCQDWFVPTPIITTKFNPKGPNSGVARCLRGGSWIYPANYCATRARGGNNPLKREFDNGLRLVRTP